MNRIFTVLLFVILFSTQNAYSQIEVVKSFYTDSKSLLDIEKIQNVEFTPIDSDILKGFSDDSVWVKLEISRKSRSSSTPLDWGTYPLVLRVGLLSLDSIEVFEKVHNSWSVQQLGDRHMTYPRICKDEYHCFYLKSTLEDPVTIYLKIQSQNLLEIHAEVVTQQDLAKTVSSTIRSSSISFAFGLCLCVIAFIFYLIERSRLILNYVFYQVSMILYLATNNGILFNVIDGNSWEVLQHTPEFFFCLRSIFFCLLCREIFIGYQVGNVYKIFNNYLIGLFTITTLLTFSHLGHELVFFNILLQLFNTVLNFYVLVKSQIPKRIKYTAFFGNTVYCIMLTEGFLYASHFLNTNNLDFFIHNYLDYRLNGVSIGIVIFAIVTFQILEKMKENQKIINEATTNAFKISLLNEQLLEQEQMVDLLTHEIKNPLNTINYAVKFVQSDGIQRDEMQDRIKKISYSASRIDSIVNQVYLSTRIDRYEQNKKPLNEQINFNELITEVVSDYEFGNSFEINTNKNLYLRNSRFLLTSIVTNLVSNAVKYSISGTTIYILIGTLLKPADSNNQSKIVKDTHFYFEISNQLDNANIPDSNKLFKRYYRHNNFLTKPGMGIGLNIVKTAVNILGGTISFRIESDLITFRTEIPL